MVHKGTAANIVHPQHPHNNPTTTPHHHHHHYPTTTHQAMLVFRYHTGHLSIVKDVLESITLVVPVPVRPDGRNARRPPQLAVRARLP